MGRDPLTPTPNIPWGWDHDDEGNVSIYIRDNAGGRVSVVLTPQQASDFAGQIKDLEWNRESVLRAFRHGVMKHQYRHFLDEGRGR